MSSDTLALLIDGDNSSPEIVSGLLAEIANYGTASVKRIYGDWTKPNLNGWKECLLEHSIQPVQQFGITAKRPTRAKATGGKLVAAKPGAEQGVAASGKLDDAAIGMLRKAVEASADEDARAALDMISNDVHTSATKR